MKKNKQPNVLLKPLAPYQQFINIEALSGIVLFICSAIALILANSSLSENFEHLWHTEIGFSIGTFEVHHSLHHWINDGLMAVFFFVIGLEIKRELLTGELSSKEKVMLPVLAAAGGAVIPALIFVAFNYGSDGVHGWGIPMATDIAFVLGIIALLGKRVPASIKIFVLAFAIIDDLIAILVIAIFYTAEINWVSLFFGVGLLASAFVLKKLGFYNTVVLLILGIISWFAFSASGIHPTIAGVIIAMTVPSLRKTSKDEYPDKVSSLLTAYNETGSETKLEKKQQQVIINEIEEVSASTESPLYKLEHILHPISSFVIMPVFALANAGIAVDATMFSSLTHPVSFGIIAALFIGKPVGICLSIWVGIKLKIATLPTGANWKHILAMASLGGMGFTLSLFISVLAFKDAQLLSYAKIGVLAGSLISIIAGITLFMLNNKSNAAAEHELH